jgi:hypothetical protein
MRKRNFKRELVPLLRKTIILLFIIGLSHAKAQFTQLSYWQWAFGSNVGMDANGTQLWPPHPLMNTIEGCSSFSDGNGNLMMYTDGRSLWRVVGGVSTLVANNLNGSPNAPAGSATQGVMILPRPGAPGQFLIFTVSDAQNPQVNHGLTCYPYNWAANILGPPAQPIFGRSYCTEAITAIPHCNGIDYWVIVKPIIGTPTAANGTLAVNNFSTDNTCLYAFLVTNAGMSFAPVVSNFGAASGAFAPQPMGPMTWVGSMKASPDREFLALGERTPNGLNGALNLYRFDCSSGTFRFILRQPQPSVAYGVSFDASSSYVYTSNGPLINRYHVDNVISQMECGGVVTGPLATDFYASGLGTPFYQLQMTPPLGNFPGSILVANPGANSVHRFNTPSLLGPNYTPNAIAITTPTNFCRSGLPNNMDATIPTVVTPLSCSVCPNKCSNTFCFQAWGCPGGNGAVTWNFGDNTSVGGLGYHTVNSTHTSGTFLNPCHTYTAPGSYTVTVSSGVQTCSQVVVVSTNWNITTKNSNQNDIGNDIVVDANENIYVAGTFETNTTFTTPCGNITISGGGSTSAYIAKFDKCSNLLWINYGSGPIGSTGTGIALDPLRNEVYMSGVGIGGGLLNFRSNAERPCVSPASGLSSFPVHQYYVARFNTNTGSFMNGYSGTIPDYVTAKPSVLIDINYNVPNLAEIFVTGSYTSSSSTQRIFVEMLNSVASMTQSWINISQNFVSGVRTVNDIAYNPSNNTAFITGSFSSSLKFNMPTLNTTSNSEAFVWGFDGSSGITNGSNKLGNSGAYEAAGTSLITEQNLVYCTGYFNNNVTNVFGSSAFSFGGGPIARYRSYVVKFNSNTLLPSSMTNAVELKSNVFPYGDVKTSGIGLDALLGELVVTGVYNNSVTAPAFSPNNGYYSNSTGDKMFEAGLLTTGLAPQWCNGTNDANIAGSLHISTKIAAVNSHCYSTGGYFGRMSYNFGTAPSGPLNATPAGNRNTYIVRNNLGVNGSFFKTTGSSESSNSLPGFSYDLKNAVTLFPNPNSGVFNIQSSIPLRQSVVEITDALGRLIFKKNYEELINDKIDISLEKSGIYFVHIQNALGEHLSFKIVKE